MKNGPMKEVAEMLKDMANLARDAIDEVGSHVYSESVGEDEWKALESRYVELFLRVSENVDKWTRKEGDDK